MFKENRNSYDNNVLFSCPLFSANFVKNDKQLALSMHYSDSLENIDVILTIRNIYRQSLNHYTSSS